MTATTTSRSVPQTAQEAGFGPTLGEMFAHIGPVGSATAEALVRAPHNLGGLEAELLFFEGQYIFHSIENGEHVYKLVSGAAVRAAFSVEPLDSGWLAPGVQRWGESALGTYAVLWIPPTDHTIQVGKDRLTVPLPGLVLLGIGRHYFLWATKGQDFQPAAQLYHAPLPNVWPSGAICWGQNVPAQASGMTVLEAWRTFISSPFNSDLSGGKSKRFPNAVEGHLAFLAQSRKATSKTARKHGERYPVKDLMPFKNEYNPISVELAIDRIAAGGEP